MESVKKQIFCFIWQSPNSAFNVHNSHGIKLLTRLRVALSHLRENKFKHNLQDSLDPFCNCGQHIETTIHFFFYCLNYSNQRKNFINIKCSSLYQNDSSVVKTLFFGSNGLIEEENAWIIESTIEYIMTWERFITPVLWIHLSKSPLLLKYLINFGSPYVIIFLNCSVVQFFLYIYFTFKAFLNVCHQGYVVHNFFFLIFFAFLLCIPIMEL